MSAVILQAYANGRPSPESFHAFVSSVRARSGIETHHALAAYVQRSQSAFYYIQCKDTFVASRFLEVSELENELYSVEPAIFIQKAQSQILGTSKSE